jgi:hypothetical protein
MTLDVKKSNSSNETTNVMTVGVEKYGLNLYNIIIIWLSPYVLSVHFLSPPKPAGLDPPNLRRRTLYYMRKSLGIKVFGFLDFFLDFFFGNFFGGFFFENYIFKNFGENFWIFFRENAERSETFGELEKLRQAKKIECWIDV